MSWMCWNWSARVLSATRFHCLRLALLCGETNVQMSFLPQPDVSTGQLSNLAGHKLLFVATFDRDLDLLHERHTNPGAAHVELDGLDAEAHGGAHKLGESAGALSELG